MKKLALALSAAVLVIVLSACSGGAASSGSASAGASGSEGSAAASSASADSASAASAEASSAAAASDANDYGWVAFEMPQGWEESFADFSKVEIKQTDGKDVEMKIAPQSTTTAGGDAEAAAAKRADQSDSNTLGEPFEQGGRAWYPVYFTMDGVDSAYLYTNISDKHVAYITAYKVTEADDAVNTVMNTLTFNEDEII